MKKYVNDPDDPKTDSPCPVPRFIYNELADQLAKIHSILRRNLTPENKVKAIFDTFANKLLSTKTERREVKQEERWVE